jgi:hypothetical protein
MRAAAAAKVCRGKVFFEITQAHESHKRRSQSYLDSTLDGPIVQPGAPWFTSRDAGSCKSCWVLMLLWTAMPPHLPCPNPNSLLVATTHSGAGTYSGAGASARLAAST